jgi:tetratricopeptide (TPR) repeat protein
LTICSAHMYKVKFAQWKIWKNYRTAQKKELLSQLVDNAENAVQTYVANLTVNNRPLKPGRLTRKVMKDGRRIELTPKLTISRVAELSINKTGIEVALHEVKRYYNWYFHQEELERDFGFSGNMDHVVSNIASARRVVGEDVKLGFAMMDTACRQIESMLMRQPFQLIQHIISELGEWQWSISARPARAALVKFVVSMTRRVFGAQHALSKIISILVQPEMKEDVVPAIVKLLADIVSEHVREDETVLEVQNYLADSLFHAGDLRGARETYLSILQRGESFGMTHSSCRRAFRNLGWLHFKQGDLAKAKTIWLEVYELNHAAAGSPNGDFGGVCTCGYIGRWYSDRGEKELAEQYLRLAFEGYLETAGRDSSGVRRYLENLEANLVSQGKIVEVAELRRRHRDLWSRWEEKKLVRLCERERHRVES